MENNNNKSDMNEGLTDQQVEALYPGMKNGLLTMTFKLAEIKAMLSFLLTLADYYQEQLKYTTDKNIQNRHEDVITAIKYLHDRFIKGMQLTTPDILH